MAMTPEQISAAVDYFSTKNTNRLQSVMSAAYGGAKGGGGGGYSGGGGGGGSGPRKPATIGAPANKPKDPGFDIGSLLGLINPLLIIPGIGEGDDEGATRIIDDAMASRDEAERPQNATQRVLDLLSGGLYATAGATHKIGEQVAQGNPNLQNMDPISAGIANVGEVAGAAVQGLQQGLGERPNGERPFTQSRNLEESGANEGIRNALGTIGVKGLPQDIAVGGVGFLADVASDPFTWVPGLGLTKAIPGAIDGGAAAVKASRLAGEGVDFGALLQGAGRGAVQGFKDAAAAREALKVARQGRKSALRNPNVATRTIDEQLDVENAYRAEQLAEPMPAGARPMGTPPENAAATLLDDIAPTPAPAAAAVPSVFDDLLGQMGKPRDVPASQILNAAMPTAKPRLIDEQLDAAVRTAIYDTAKVADFDAAMKAVRALPGGAELLGKRIRVEGKPTTVRAAMERAAVRRLTEDKPERIAPWVNALEEVLKIGSKVERSAPTPASLSAAVEKYLPGMQLPDGGAGLLAQLQASAKGGQSAVKAALKAALEGGGTPYATFDDAIQGAIEGRVEMSMMRSMLEALGITSKATTAKGMRAAIGKHGKLNWEAIQNSVPTAQEALNSHGVSPAAAQAAANTDPTPIIEGAADEFDAILEREVGFNPLNLEPTPAPTAAGTTGRMVRAGVKVLDERVNPNDPAAVEQFGMDLWLDTHRAMFAELGKAINTGRAGGKKGLTGAQRAEQAFARWLPAMRAVTSHAVSRGMIPRLQYKPGSRPLYLSMDQIAEALPEPIISNALFNLNYRLTKFGEGTGDAAAEQFKLGLSVYPTHIAEGVRVAIRGGNRDEVLAAMSRFPNAFEKTKPGKQALADLAEAMDNPIFRTEMGTLHEAQEIAAVAIAMRAADNVVNPVARQIVQAIARNGDRSTVFVKLDKALNAARDVAKAGDDSLVRELAQQRVENGALETLGKVDTALLRSDRRMAKVDGERSILEQADALLAANASKAGSKAPDGTPVKPEIPKGGKNTSAKRAATAQAQRQLHDDLEPEIDEMAMQNVLDGAYEATDYGYINSISELDQALGGWQVWAKAGRAIEGSYGQGMLKALQVQISSGTFVHSHAYEANLNEWLHGSQVGGVLGVGTTAKPGLGPRLGEALGLGRPATIEESNAAIARWWHALGTHTTMRLKNGDIPTDEYMEMALLQGARRDPELGLATDAPPLAPPEAALAMELYAKINEVFAPVAGPLARSGVTTADLMREMGRYGFHAEGPFANFMLKGDFSPADSAAIWAGYDTSLMNAPLDVLANWHKALSAASVRPSLGASISHLLDHVAEGLTREEAIAQGWKRINPKQDGAGVGAYVDPNSYFAPEVLTRITYLNNFLEQMGKPLAGGKLNGALRVFDATTSALKSSMTIWNPSHHVTNVLGEMAMLVMAGVNPAQAIRAFPAIKAGGKLLDVADPLGTYKMNLPETAIDMTTFNGKADWASGNAIVVIRDASGKQTKVGLTPAQIWTRALNDGVALTARESKDMLPGASISDSASRTSRFAAKVSQHNPIAKLDHKLGEFSAVRDNLTRLGHYYHMLEQGEYRSLEEAFAAAARQVHSYHPTIQTLSATDQKITRRIIFFHTWVRQAAGRIIQTMLEKPAYITLPAKWQYAQAEAAGLEPDSIGKPFNGDPRIASYYYDGVYGPTREAGLEPMGGLGDLAAGEAPHLWGYSLSSPQLDALYTFFGGIQMDEGVTGGLGGFIEKQAQGLNPLLKAPIELLSHNKIGGIGGEISTDQDILDYVWNSTGAPARLGNALGVTGAKPSLTPAENKANADRLLVNYLTGLKLTDYTNTTSAGIAKQERSAWELNYLRELGYSDDQIKIIREAWKAQRGY